MTLGERITLERKRKGWTQKELGSKVGRGRHAIMGLENDESFPEPKIVDQIFKLLGIEI